MGLKMTMMNKMMK